MKLTLFKILLSLVIVNIIMSAKITSNLSSKQLFEVLDQTTNQNNNKPKDSEKSLSIFDVASNDASAKNKPAVNNKKSDTIFNQINFNQVSEKIQNTNKNSNANASKNTNSNTNSSTNKSQTANKNNAQTNNQFMSKAQSRARAKLSSKLSKKIEKLRNHMHDIVKSNDKLTTKMNKHETKRQNEINDSIIKFIQAYEQNVHNLKHELRHDKKQVKFEFAQKESQFSTNYEEANQLFLETKSNIQDMNQNLEKILQKQNENEKKIKNGLELDNLTIKNNLDVDGVLYAKKIKAEQADLKDISINQSNIKVGDNVKLQIGGQNIFLDGLIGNVDFVEKLQDYCGEDYSKCRLISQDDISEQDNKQENILKNLKKLRSETAEILNMQRNAYNEESEAQGEEEEY